MIYNLPLLTEVPLAAPFGPTATPAERVTDRPADPVTVVFTPAAAPLGPATAPAVLLTETALLL